MKRAALKLTLALTILAGALVAAVPTGATPGCKPQSPSVCPSAVAPVACQSRNHKTQVYINACVAASDCATACFPL